MKRRTKVSLSLFIAVAVALVGIWLLTLEPDRSQKPKDLGGLSVSTSGDLFDSNEETTTTNSFYRSKAAHDAATLSNTLTRGNSEKTACESAAAKWFGQRDDAESIITAAMLSLNEWRQENREERLRASLALLERAAWRAPSDASVRWLALSVCSHLPDCDMSVHEGALRLIDPENGAGWIHAANRALALNDHMGRQRELEAALESLANADRFDLYWLDYSSRSFQALATAPIPLPEEVQECVEHNTNALAGIYAAMSLPVLGPLSKECRQTSDVKSMTRCKSIATAFRKGDTVLVQAIGFHMGLALASRDSDEFRSLSEEQRIFDWQRWNAVQFQHPLSDDWMRLHRESRREIDLMQSVLREQGVPLSPPIGWTMSTGSR